MAHLDEAPERAAFMRCDWSDDKVFRVRELLLVAQAAGLGQGPFQRCDLDDDVRSSIFRWATNDDNCLVEAHSHGHLFSPAVFSTFDIRQLDEWVPHVRWRLGGRPYAALVTAADIDGVAWIGDARESVSSVDVDGRSIRPTTGLSIRRMEKADDRLS